MSVALRIEKQNPRNTTCLRFDRQYQLSILILLIAAVISVSLPSRVFAVTDPCAVFKPEEISKVLGDTFGGPTKQATPPGPFAGELVRCDYQGKKLTFALTNEEYPTTAKRDVNWTARHSRWPGMMHAVELPGLGDQAMYTHNKIWSNKGLHDYEFSLSGSSEDRKDQLLTVAKLFYSRH